MMLYSLLYINIDKAEYAEILGVYSTKEQAVLQLLERANYREKDGVLTQYMENTHADRKLQAQIDQLKRQLEQEQSKLKKESDEGTMLIQSNHEIQKLIALEVRKQLGK